MGKQHRWAISLVLAAAALGAATQPAEGEIHDARPAPESAAAGWQGWVTSPTDAGRRLTPVRPVLTAPTASIVFDPSQLRQVWRGVGASLTDASVGLLRGNAAATKLLFSPTDAQGARLNWVRLPLSSTDFSPNLWSWTTAGPPVEQVRSVNYLLNEVKPLRRDLAVVGTAWSAPASMKHSATLRGGALREASESAYGDLVVQQATWLRSQGVPLRAMTLGNEPYYSPDYTSMTMTTPQQARLAAVVSPRLKSRSVQLWAVDHNWSHRAEYDSVLGAAPGAFAAAAVHCYAGTPGRMAGLPVRSILTECTGTNDTWSGTFAWDETNLVVRAIDAGSAGLLMWNLALDGQHGPIDPGSQRGCKNCRGLLTITQTGVTKEPEFFTLAHLSRAARSGARVIATATQGPVIATAFRNPDGTIGITGHNQSSRTEVVDVRVRGGAGVRFSVGPGEMVTFTGSAPAPDTTLKGAVVRSSTGQAFLVDNAGFRHPITDPWVAACLPAPSQTVSNLTRFPLGEDAGCPPTRDVVYSTDDGASYLITGYPRRPKRRWMPTAEAYFCALNAGYSVVHGPSYVVREIPMGEDLPPTCP